LCVCENTLPFELLSLFFFWCLVSFAVFAVRLLDWTLFFILKNVREDHVSLKVYILRDDHFYVPFGHVIPFPTPVQQSFFDT